MKKLMFAIGLVLIASGAYAACMGPFCYDDTGASIGGYSFDGNGLVIPSLSSTTIVGLTPKAVGQLVYCNSCTTNGGTAGKVICYSTGTAVGAFVVNASTVPACK